MIKLSDSGIRTADAAGFWEKLANASVTDAKCEGKSAVRLLNLSGRMNK